MKIESRRGIAPLGLIVLGLASSAIFCAIDTTSPGHPAQVEPALAVEPVPVCPGETVTVSWDVGPQPEDCIDGRLTAGSRVGRPTGDLFCTEVTLSSSDSGHDTAIGTFENEGQRDFVLAVTTTFTLIARYDPNPFLPGERTVSVEARVREALPVDEWPLNPHCEGGLHWDALDLKDRYGPCTLIGEICNQSSVTTITLVDDLGHAVRLEPGACTGDWAGTGGALAPTIHVQSAEHASAPMWCTGGDVAGAVDPPRVTLGVGLACRPFDEETGACTAVSSVPLEVEPGDPLLREREEACGNGVCEPEFGEDNGLCPADCPLVGPDTSLPGVGVATCGDALCDAALGETCALCEIDCGPCVPTSGQGAACPAGPGACCGDGVCQIDESADWCGDCAPSAGGGDGGADGGGDGDQPPPSGPVCGNGQCESGESDKSCPLDCTAVQKPVCGDGVCAPGEQGCGVCSADCGPC